MKLKVDNKKNTITISLGNPSKSSAKPEPQIVKNLVNDTVPMIWIGILTQDFTTYMAKVLSKKWENKLFNDFYFEDLNPQETGESQIKSFLETINGHTFIDTSYTKFLTVYKNVFVIPLDVNSSEEQFSNMMSYLDAVLLTGGSSEFFQKVSLKIDTENKTASRLVKDVKTPTKFFKAVKTLIKLAKQINDSGREFPFWGTCLGFEGMILNEAPESFKLDLFKDIKKTHSIVLTDDDGTVVEEPLEDKSIIQKKNLKEDSEISISMNGVTTKIQLDNSQKDLNKKKKSPISNFSEDFKEFITSEFSNKKSEKLFYYYHHYGFTVKNFIAEPLLTETFRILAISDQNDFEGPNSNPPNLNDKVVYSNALVKNIEQMINKPSKKENSFISIFAYKKYPFYGVQFHPEKPLYDTESNPAVHHDEITKIENKKFSGFFINKVRNAKNRNTQKGKKLKKKDLQTMSRFIVKHVGLATQIMVFKSS